MIAACVIEAALLWNRSIDLVPLSDIMLGDIVSVHYYIYLHWYQYMLIWSLMIKFNTFKFNMYKVDRRLRKSCKFVFVWNQESSVDFWDFGLFEDILMLHFAWLDLKSEPIPFRFVHHHEVFMRHFLWSLHKILIFDSGCVWSMTELAWIFNVSVNQKTACIYPIRSWLAEICKWFAE